MFTFFNGLWASLFVLVALTGRWQNGLFGVIVVANAVIGIVQEWRAKQTLHRLALLHSPHARVIRATRAVAQLVLLDGRFAHLPEAVAEGRRVVANIERAASLFLVKNVYSLVMALISVVTLMAFPSAPMQLALISSITVGIPGFFLAPASKRTRYVSGFLRRVLRFSLPVGVVTGVCAYAGYAAARWLDPESGIPGAQGTATLVVLVVALWALVVLRPPAHALEGAADRRHGRRRGGRRRRSGARTGLRAAAPHPTRAGGGRGDRRGRCRPRRGGRPPGGAPRGCHRAAAMTRRRASARTASGAAAPQARWTTSSTTRAGFSSR